MTLAVDKPILNNPFEEPKEYWIYDEGSAKKDADRKPAGYYFRTGKSQNGQIGLFAEEQFKPLALVNTIREGLRVA